MKRTRGLAEDVIQDGKTWDKCFKYIVEQAKKIPRSGNGVAVEDRVVYEWAEDYYHKEDKPEPVKKENGKKQTANRKLKQDAPKAEKKEKTKKKETPKKTEKPVMEGQMSLFDLL